MVTHENIHCTADFLHCSNIVDYFATVKKVRLPMNRKIVLSVMNHVGSHIGTAANIASVHRTDVLLGMHARVEGGSSG